MRDVILKAGIPDPNGGDDYLKIQTVKFVKDTLGLGLKEAKELVDAIPSKIAEKVTDEKAEELTKVFEKEGMKIEVRDSLGKPHYWIMGTPNRGDDVYDLLHDKDRLLQLEIDVSKEMIENPSHLLWINDSHEINAISVEDNVSLVNLITKSWTELELPWKPEDKEFVLAYDNRDSCTRTLAFYDAVNDCIFTFRGTRNGPEYDHYAPFKGEYPEWAKEALKRLED